MTVRALVVVIVPVAGQLAAPDGDGPLPLQLPDGLEADAEARASYFAERVLPVLYGPGRTYRALREDIGRFTAEALELVSFAPGHQCFAALHLVWAGPDAEELVEALSTLCRPVARDHPLRQLLPRYGLTLSTSVRRARTLTFATSTAPWLPLAFGEGYDDWTPQDRVLWSLASASSFTNFPPAPSAYAQSFATRVVVSADWQALVLRDGWALVGTRSDAGKDDKYYRYAEIYARTIYLDTLLLGEIQRERIGRLADEFATLPDPTADPVALRALYRALASFRHRYWWQHVSGHGPSSQLLAAYHAQHRLPDLLNQVATELSQHAEQVQATAAQRTNAMLGAIAVVGLPLSGSLTAAQILGASGLADLGLALACALAISVAIITTAGGRQLLGALRSPKS